MDKGIIITKLKDYPKEKVDIYINYLTALNNEKDKEGKQVNWWSSRISNDEFVNAFIKVYNYGIFIDGDTVTLNYRKKLVITFDYHAYKNMILSKYPDSIFDASVVYKGDSFSFKKVSGKVEYTHEINDPFSTTKEIIGAYCILKNKRGEFIELLDMSTIEKMKNTSQMKNIWNTWFDRMVLKSALRRICTIHFKDISEGVEKLDDETNDLNMATLPEELQMVLDEVTDVAQLETIYKNNMKDESIDTRALINACKSVRKRLEGGNND